MEQITERNRRKLDKPTCEFADNLALSAIVIMITAFAMILVM